MNILHGVLLTHRHCSLDIVHILFIVHDTVFVTGAYDVMYVIGVNITFILNYNIDYFKLLYLIFNKIVMYVFIKVQCSINPTNLI